MCFWSVHKIINVAFAFSFQIKTKKQLRTNQQQRNWPYLKKTKKVWIAQRYLYFQAYNYTFFADPCVYFNLEFKGGDLSVIPSLGFAACKLECQKLKDCAFFTINKVACVLKDANVEIQRKTGVISGATDSTCGKCHKKQTKQMVCY